MTGNLFSYPVEKSNFNYSVLELPLNRPINLDFILVLLGFPRSFSFCLISVTDIFSMFSSGALFFVQFASASFISDSIFAFLNNFDCLTN